MKKLTATIALIITLSSLLSAQVIHEFSVFSGGGLSALRYKLPHGDVSGKFGGEFGVGYYIGGTKIGVHTGIGLGFYGAETKLNNTETVTSDLRDSEDDRFDLHTNISGYNETAKTMFLNIPVAAQFQTGLFYAMGGIKLGIPLNCKYESSVAALINEAYYPAWENWATTQTFAGYGAFRDKNYNGNFDLALNAALTLEAGINMSVGDNIVLYGGAYFDYGLSNVAKGDRLKFINYSANDAENFTVNSALSSYSNDSNSTTFTDKVKVMAVGIKLRAAFRK